MWLERQPAFQPPDDPRLLGLNRSLFAEREAVRANHSDDLAVLRDRLPGERRRRVPGRRGMLAAPAGRRSVVRSVVAQGGHRKDFAIGRARAQSPCASYTGVARRDDWPWRRGSTTARGSGRTSAPLRRARPCRQPAGGCSLSSWARARSNSASTRSISSSASATDGSTPSNPSSAFAADGSARIASTPICAVATSVNRSSPVR